MKKTLFGLMACFLLVGCGNTLKCTLDEEGEGTAVYKLKFKDDKVSKVTMQVNFEDKEEAETACEMYKSLGEDSSTAKVKCSGKKLTITSTDDSEFEDMTKEEAKEELEDMGFKCK